MLYFLRKIWNENLLARLICSCHSTNESKSSWRVVIRMADLKRLGLDNKIWEKPNKEWFQKNNCVRYLIPCLITISASRQVPYPSTKSLLRILSYRRWLLRWRSELGVLSEFCKREVLWASFWILVPTLRTFLMQSLPFPSFSCPDCKNLKNPSLTICTIITDKRQYRNFTKFSAHRTSWVIRVRLSRIWGGEQLSSKMRPLIRFWKRIRAKRLRMV